MHIYIIYTTNYKYIYTYNSLWLNAYTYFLCVHEYLVYGQSIPSFGESKYINAQVCG